ncbi:YpdA family putative bacillithiol disulfide reductase [Flammeovirga yaeyamensis]|uniref:YpdA family putative bacillithiol disulfide reductase n=1 Tax=Flammeovirga yaeyamensis TaxID=367791 RepID=A0AAX1N706_9BACT|nr:YpdA family putative bacillithiol disulfide reductase [Flammeovirga yaeyamensis]MBB3697846.1 putative YpdA family bacillithiol system oxidoreductase [Flammeovirga yaeyamensis]NMF35798.1 YpdA family putative bacillithiol disulfide reductase [Flammeovirga yaeyamensis]QWG03250.1 YpdA family putative bacillithiol disulfide reductase [Flammeovirga yaeyamensis]
MIYDNIIVGGGPIGLACGIEAEKKGLSYLILEKGCLVNSLYHYPVNMTFFSTSEKLEIGNAPFVSHNHRPVRREALEYYRRVQTTWDLNIHLFEKVLNVDKSFNEEEVYKIKTSKGEYLAKTVTIATGFYDIPNLMHVPGEDLPKVKHYYDDPHLYSFTDVAVIGGANSAIDAALETYRKGANVTLIIREEEINDRVKYWVKPDIENRIKEGSIKVFFQHEVKEVTPTEIIIEDMNSKELTRLSNDFVLAMTGYQPDFDFLQRIGITLSDDHIKAPEYNTNTHESNQEGIYLAGVVCGGMKTNSWFIENSRVHAEMIYENIHLKLKK